MTESPDNSTARTPRSVRAVRGTALAAAACANGVLTVRWRDVLPGRMMRDPTVWLTVRAAEGDEPLVAWDDMPAADIRVEERSSLAAVWRYTWRGAQRHASYTITIRPQHADSLRLTASCEPGVIPEVPARQKASAAAACSGRCDCGLRPRR
jgi:hypothetical protein